MHMTEPRTTLQLIEEIARDVLDDDSLVLTADTRPVDIEGWDSLANVSIVFGIEEAYEAEIDDLLITDFQTIGELAAIIDRRG